jgi:hypothetical protein
VVVLPHPDRRPYERSRDQEVARDLLRPRGRVVEGVAREELIEDHQREHPEDAEREPVLEAVDRQVHGFVVDVELTRRGEDVFFRFHLSSF